MSTIDQKEYPSSFSGLTSTAITASVFIGVSLCLEDTLRRLRRYPAEDAARKAGAKDVRDRGMEQWAMGYLFRARTFVWPAPVTPDYSNWALVWIWRAIRLPESFFESHCGPDATVYVRFLRGTFCWLLLMLCTIFPVLTSINFIYSPDDISTSSIERASISSLIQSANGKGLLWVHVICIWFISLTWIAMLVWLGFGAVRIRRNVLRALLHTTRESSQIVGSDDLSTGAALQLLPTNDVPASDVGWRFRTVLMRNIPEAMRSELAIREYFELHLRGLDYPGDPAPRTTSTKQAPKALPELSTDLKVYPLIAAVILVRKQGELNEQWVKYKEALQQLEAAHVALAQNVMAWVQAKVRAAEKVGGKVETEPPARPWWKLWRSKEEKEIEKVVGDVEKEVRSGDDIVLAAMREFLPGATPKLDEKTGEPRSIYTALHDLDPIFLDRFQPLFKLKHFRGQAVPAIDYFVTKLNLTQRLIEEHRSRPDGCDAASTAFITFTRASDALRARTELASRPGSKLMGGRAFECKIQPAPEFRDLDWNRLVYVSLSADIVRSIVLQIIIWAATIFWVIPISFLVGLLSLSSIAKYIPALATYLIAHPAVNSLFSNLLPTSIVALLGMLVPTFIGMLTRNGQTFFTESKLLLEVQARYWKWSFFNIVLVFCVGLSAFTAFLNAFKSPGSVLTVIATAFPKGATFFVSWSLLVIGVHHGVQHALLGIPYINHATVRKVKSPRKREIESLPRFFSYHYWVPNHLLVVAVTAIFAILNPMVIPFNFAYFAFAVVVFKNQFAHVYWRRCFEGNGRAVYKRLYRYSLDSFLVAQIVAVALLEVLKYYRLGGAIIPLLPLTAFIKLIGTRYFDLLMDEIDQAEAVITCGESTGSLGLSVPLENPDTNVRHKMGSLKAFATRTLPALTFRPHSHLPSTVSHSRAGTHPARLESEHSGIRFSQPRSPTSIEAARPILAATRSRESCEESAPGHLDQTGLSLPPAAVTPGQDLKTDAKGSPKSPLRLITPHAPVLRDDRVQNHIHYDNPALVTPLARSLWLPREPLLPVDLGDTIDYHGKALVSSEGGSGILGMWDEHVTVAEAGDVTVDGARRVPSSAGTVNDTDEPFISPTSKLLAEHVPLGGTERIRVASEVAARVEEDETLVAPERRHGIGVSDSGSSIRSQLSRRATNASGRSTAGGSMVMSSSPQPSPSLLAPKGSPTLRPHSFELRPSPPSNPSFGTPGNSALAPPPGEYPPTPHQLERDDVFSTSTLARAASRESGLIVPSGSPRAPRQQRSASTSTFFRERSPSSSSTHRPSDLRLASSTSRMSIAEAVEEAEEDVVEVSQAAAMRSEILEEERLEHEKRLAKEEKRAEGERKDRRAGWLTKLLVADTDNAVVPAE